MNDEDEKQCAIHNVRRSVLVKKFMENKATLTIQINMELEKTTRETKLGISKTHLKCSMILYCF